MPTAQPTPAPRRSRRALLASVAAAGALLLAGCTTGSTNSSSADNADTAASTSVDANAFPVTIKHAFGSTTIDSEPKRVVTLGWTDQDHALALGVVPVGATKITWGGNAAGSTNWFDAALKENGGTAPVRYDDTDGVPIDEIAKLTPDLILATNSGITKADYAKLTKIAKVVAYPEAPWVTPWQTSLETVGKALGRSELADELEDTTEDAIDKAAAANPQLKDTSFVYGYLATTDLSQVGIYASEDPRVALLRDFGMVDAPAAVAAVKKGEFYGQVSAEKAADLDSDLFITWAENDKDVATFEKNRLIGQIPAIADGHFYAESDKSLAMASTNPTPLSVPVIIDQVLPKIVAALEG